MNAIELSLVTLWANASKLTADESLCRARWSIVLDHIESILRTHELTHHEVIALNTAWDLAVFHRFDYSTTPPGYQVNL